MTLEERTRAHKVGDTYISVFAGDNHGEVRVAGRLYYLHPRELASQDALRILLQQETDEVYNAIIVMLKDFL